MSTLGGTRGERNAKPKFAALDINKLYITSRGESLEPSSQKSAVPRKHGMQSLGKVPTARRPPANLPSLKAEVGNPGEQSGSWTSDYTEGQNLTKSSSDLPDKNTTSPNASVSSTSAQHQPASLNNSKTCESSWNTNEFPSLDGTGSYGGNVNSKSQQFQDHYPGASQSMMRPHNDPQFRAQQKGSNGRGTVPNIATEDTDGGGGGGNSVSGSTMATNSQSPPLPPQFRALLPPFMQRGSDSGLTGNENEGGSSSLPPVPAASHLSTTVMNNDSKNNNIVPNVTNNGNNLDNSKMSNNSGKRNNNYEGIANSSNFGTVNTAMNTTKPSNQFPQKQPPSSVLHSQQQQNSRIGGGHNFSSMPTSRGGRVVRGASGAGNNPGSEGNTERASGAGYNDNYMQAHRRGAMNHQPRYANRGMTGVGAGNYNSSAGHVRNDGGGGNVGGSGNAGSPSGFHEDSRNSHPPYGSGVLTEQEVVVRPIIRDEELQRLEAIAKDEGWAKDYEFDYNQKLEFSDDESEINPTPTAAKDKHTTMDKEDTYEKNTTGAIAEKETDSEKVDRNNRGQEHGGGPVAYKERESKQDQESNMIIGNVGSGVRGEGGVINVNITAGGLDAAEAKERIKQRREEDQKREIERKQAAARKLQELEEKLSRKKNDESVDSKPGNNDKGSGGGVNVAVSSAGNVTSSSNRSEEEKSVEGIAAHTSERTISIKIRGKSGERANVKDIRYDFGTGGGGARHDRDGGNVVGGNAGTNWDLPGFSKTFQSNLPPRFQKRKLERNTSGTNLSTNANNATGNQIASRTSNSYSSSGSTGPAAINAGSEIKSTIPFAQQYDPRYIHNQQTYGRGVTANAMSNSRRSGMATSGAPVRERERDERPRQQYDTRDTHNQREATKEKADTAEENSRFGGGIQDSSSNQAKQTTGGRITPQLVRSLSESSNRKTSISSDENHHNVAHHASSATHNSGSVATKSGNYGREKSWDMEAEKGSSASSPASFSGSERHREIPLRFDNDQPKQILHRVKEMTSQISEVVKEDKIVIKRIARSGESEGESEQKDTGLESGKHPLSDNAATVQDSKTSFAIDVTDPDRNSIDSNAAVENVNKMFQTEEISSFGVVEPNIKENMENEGSKDVAHLDNSYQSRALSGADDKKQLAASSVTVSASSQQHSGKKKGVPLVQQQQHPRDNRRHDTRGGSRGGSYSGGYHRADLTGSSSTLRGGTSNWNRARGGNRVGAGSRSYNQDYWSESEFSEEGFDEQPKHHLHQKIYNHSMMGTTGAQNTDIGSITSKEGFVPRGEPSRRGRGGGNVGSTVVVASSSNTANRQKQQQASFSGCGVSSMDGAGNISKKMEGYGPPSSKSPFGGGTGNGGDDRNTKHRVGDSLSSNASAGSPTRDDRDIQKRTRPISFTDAGKAMEDTPTSIDHEKLCAIVGERKPGAIEVRNDESHSTEDNLASQKPGGRSNVSENRMAMESSDAGVANKPGTITEDMKTKSKSIVTPITSKIGSSLTTSLVEGSSNIANNNPPDSNLASIGIARGSGNNHLVTRKQQQTASRGQGAKLSNTDTMTDISSGGSNATQAVPNLMNINNSGGKAAANIVTRPTTIPIDGERSSHLQQQQQQQSVTEKLAASSPVNNAKTDNDKHNLDGNTPPVNTIIFENTNFKSGVSVAVLSGSSSSPVVVDCGGVGGDTTMNSLRRQQSGNSVTNFGAKVNAGLMNEKMAGGAAGVVGALQSMTSSASSHRPIASPTVTAANESGLQHNIVGSSQRTALSAGVPKQQPCNMIASSIQGIPFQKSENDYKDIKSYAFETDISHLIDGDKGMKQQSSVSAGLCLSKSIEAEGGGNNHGAGVAVSVKNMISPSTADLNMKIASVKKVWEMPTVPEQAGSVVNAGSASSANRVNVASEHSVSGGGSGVGGGSNVHLKSNFVRGPHHASHQPQYQHPHPGSANHHAHPTHGTHQSYAAAFGSDSDSLVDHFNNSNSVCNVSSSAGVANNGCDMNSAINLNNECSDSSSGGYGLSHHHSQQQPAKSHQQQTQAHQLQQQHQQELQHQRQSHNMAESSSQQSSQQQHVQQQQKQLQQHQPQHSLQQHTQQMQRQQQQHKEQPQHMQQLQQLHQQTQQSQHKTQTQSQSQPQSQLQTQAPSQSQPQSQTQTSQSQSQAQSQLKTQQQSQQLPQQLTQSQAQQHPHQHQQQHPGHKQSQLQQQLQQHPVQQHPQQMQQSHHQQSLQLQHQQQTQQQSQQQHVSSVGVQQQQQQQHQAAVAVSLGLNKQHPVADALAAAVAANVNVCKVKPTQQNNGSGMHQSSSMGLSPPPQMQSGSMPSAPQPFYPAQYGVSAIPSPPAVLYNSPAVAAAAMNSQGGLYNAFQIEPSGRSQFSQFPGHYGTSGTAGPYNAYMTTPTNMQAGPTPEMFQSLSSQFRMGSVQSPYNQTTQMGNPNTMLISSNNSSLMSSSVKSSTQQIGAIGQPKPNGGGSVSQPPYGQQYLNMFPPAPLQNTAANYYSSSGGNQTAFFGTAAATGAGTQNAYGIPAAAVAASNMFGSHGGQNPSNTPQPPPPQQQMPSYSSQFLNSPLLAATNPAMGQQQYRGAPNNSSQHSGANAAAYIKSNQSPQSSHIQQQQQQQQQDWELQNQLMQHQPQIANLQGQSAPSQQLSLLSTGPASAQQNTQGTQHLSNNRNTLPVNQANNQFVGCGGGSNSAPGNGNPVVASGGGNVNTGPSSIRGHPPAQAQGASGTRYPSPIQRPTNFAHAQSLGVQHHQQRGGRPIGYGQQNVGTNGGGGHQPQGSGSNVAQGVNNSSKHFYGGNRG